MFSEQKPPAPKFRHPPFSSQPMYSPPMYSPQPQMQSKESVSMSSFHGGQSEEEQLRQLQEEGWPTVDIPQQQRTVQQEPEPQMQQQFNVNVYNSQPQQQQPQQQEQQQQLILSPEIAGPVLAPTFHHDLCDCCAEPGLCCAAMFCAPCVLGEVRSRRDGINDWANSSCLMYCGLSVLAAATNIPFQACYGCNNRQKTRRKYGLIEQPCEDCCCHLFCVPCALVQEMREVNAQNLRVPRCGSCGQRRDLPARPGDAVLYANAQPPIASAPPLGQPGQPMVV